MTTEDKKAKEIAMKQYPAAYSARFYPRINLDANLLPKEPRPKTNVFRAKKMKITNRETNEVFESVKAGIGPAILADLLTSDNQSASVDNIHDKFYPDDPPSSKRSVNSPISRLNRLLLKEIGDCIILNDLTSSKPISEYRVNPLFDVEMVDVDPDQE